MRQKTGGSACLSTSNGLSRWSGPVGSNSIVVIQQRGHDLREVGVPRVDHVEVVRALQFEQAALRTGALDIRACVLDRNAVVARPVNEDLRNTEWQHAPRIRGVVIRGIAEELADRVAAEALARRRLEVADRAEPDGGCGALLRGEP